MLETSQTVLEVPRTNSAAIRFPEAVKDSDERRLEKLEKNKIEYRNRKATGLCSHGRCPEKSEPGHTHCQNHLQAMARHASERRGQRIADGLCIHCGLRPRFWGRRCIICRQLFAKHPLPSGARTALRRYREAEARRELEQIRSKAQLAARKLLASGMLKRKAAKALRLYLGLDDGKWRPYRDIGKQMKLSGERVRQLLLPSKLALSESLSGRIPWVRERARRTKTLRAQTFSRSTGNLAILRVRDEESYLFQECGLRNIVLLGLVNNGEDVMIPEQHSLNRVLATAILLKPGPLTGRELRFLRTVMELSPAEFAAKLGVNFLTIRTWEQDKVVRGPNDLAARVVIAAHGFAPEVCAQLFKRLKANRKEAVSSNEIRALWIQSEFCWKLVSENENCEPARAVADIRKARAVSV